MPAAVNGGARQLAGPALAAALRDARAATLACVLDLDEAAWLPPRGAGVNPIAWELGHLAWFAEFWILRGPHRANSEGFIEAARPARLAGPDALYDSARLGHAGRWQHPWRSRADTVAVLAAQLDACIEAIPAGDDDDAALYFHRLALFHEDMHGEAFRWLRAALGHPAPTGLVLADQAPRTSLAVAEGEACIGRQPGEPGFAFDNELPAARVPLAAFDIDSTPVGNADFLAFVEDGGYRRDSLWPVAAAPWRAAGGGASHPARWRCREGAWEERWFDHWRPLPTLQPVVHVNAWEAEAWCRWAGRRLPRAAEWQQAAQSRPGLHWGRSVWEWTADAFEPYPGFVAGPYRDYSQPWFGSHRELRGGSFATHDRLHDTAYRNFFTPERNDIFAGFRSAGPPRRPA